MDIVTIDFETYYDREYSLSKMTTEAYIRDDRFEVIGVGVKVNNHPTDWYSGNDVGKFLNSLDYSNKAILAHNTVLMEQYCHGTMVSSLNFGSILYLWQDHITMQLWGVH